MTLLHDPLDLTPDYSRSLQSRPGTTQSGRLVAVPITPNDRLTIINQLPVRHHRWRDFMKRRENGEPLERLWRDAKCSPDEFNDGLSVCYNWVESALHDLAMRRAKLLP